MVGKRSILANLAINDLVELLACRSQLQPLAATMLLNQIGRHWDCFAIIAANGCDCLDVNLHVAPLGKVTALDDVFTKLNAMLADYSYGGLLKSSH